MGRKHVSVICLTYRIDVVVVSTRDQECSIDVINE